VFQVTFDLLQRFHIGVGWEPQGKLGREDRGDEAILDRVRLEMGLVASVPDRHERTRHHFRVLEGSIVLDDLTTRGLLFAYDWSHRARRPFLRTTDFFGEPERHDLYMDVGFGVEIL